MRLNDLGVRLSGVCIEEPKARISAKEITVDLKDLRVRLNGVCTEQLDAKETPQAGHELRQTTGAR